MMPLRSFLTLLVATLLLARPAHAQLKADELLLVVNGNVKDSIRIAEYYARARNVPDGRICKLDLPAGEEIPFELYERNVVPQIRAFLREHQLEKQVRCLVTFYGTPIRIAAPKPTPDQQREMAECRTAGIAAENQAKLELKTLEDFTLLHNPAFQPPIADELPLRLEKTYQALGPAIGTIKDPAERQAAIDRVKTSTGILLGELGLIQRFGARELADPTTPLDVKKNWVERTLKIQEVLKILAACNDRRFDPTERARARQLLQENCGLVSYSAVCKGQADYFTTDEALAAFDSELALLWHDWYSRAKWQYNALFYTVHGYVGQPILMTCRIDGPDASVPVEIILASTRAEQTGLTGKCVIDTRGLTDPKSTYTPYDQSLRNLAEIVRTRTKVPLVYDDRDAVLPAGSVKGVAMYCGWYSVGNYIPACQFVPGAIAFHVASFEMTSLRDPKNHGWVRGLLKDGVAGTTGPVAEPYLFAFPDADEFFPLLMTGKLTLAETYWKTQKLVSWQMSLIGDPLYRPFAKDPALSVQDLPEKLKSALPQTGIPQTGVPQTGGPQNGG